MKIRLDELRRDAYGNLETPSLILEKPHGEVIGPLSLFHSLKAELKFNDLSVVTFTYPAVVDGIAIPFYDQVVKGKVVRVEPLGVFIIATCDEYGDGIQAYKEVTLYSREYELGGKQMIFAAGTYNFWNPADVENTMLGMAIADAPNWGVGHVSPSLIGRYRTFDETNEKTLDCLSRVQAPYGAIIVYDSFHRLIEAYDVNEAPATVPIYLSYDNLVKEQTITTMEDSFATKLYVRGADGVDIREVNPTGDNFIYNLDYHIANGDIPSNLAEKWINWQNKIEAQREYYTSLVSLLNTTISRKVVENAKLVDLNNDLNVAENVRSTILQGQMGTPTYDSTYNDYQNMLVEQNSKIEELQKDVKEQKALIEEIQADIDRLSADITTINSQLRLSNPDNFEPEDLLILDHYFRQDTFEDTTFAVFDVDVSGSDNYVSSRDIPILFEDSKFVSVPCDDTHKISSISGGKLTIDATVDDEEYRLSAAIVSGIRDRMENQTVYSLCLGPGELNGSKFPSGNLVFVASEYCAKVSDYYNATNMTVTPAYSVTKYVSDKVSFDPASGKYTLVDPIEVVIADGENLTEYLQNTLPGKYMSRSVTFNEVMYIPNDAVIKYMSNYYESLGYYVTTYTVEAQTDLLAMHGFISNANDVESETSIYFTRNATEYQKFSVQKELYDYAVQCHEEIASPAYEFEIECGNFVADQNYDAFRDVVQLGCSCYLQMPKFNLTPLLIELHINFEDLNDFKLIFSNTFRRPDDVNKLKDTIKEISSSSQAFDSNKFNYGQNNNTTTWVQNLLTNGYNAALAQIQAGKDNLVTINEAGVLIDSSNGIDRIALNNGMIALVDKQNNTVKMAMGHFFNSASKTDFVGILADIIGGTLLAGQNLIIECPSNDPGGVMQFKVDNSGVVMNGGRMYLNNTVGSIGLDANCGFFAGKKDLFKATDEGYATPVCFKGYDTDSKAILELDDDGFPVNTNVWFGIDGQTFVRGHIVATSGSFTGDIYAHNYYFHDGNDIKTLLNEATKKFDLSGLDYIDLGGITLDGKTGNINFTNTGSITWGNNPPVKYQYSPDGENDWSDIMRSTDRYRKDCIGGDWGEAYQFRGNDGSDGSDADVTKANIIEALRNTDSSFISVDSLGAPEIYGGKFYAGNGDNAFAQMDGSAFALYAADVDNARASLSATTDMVQLILGTGDSAGSTTSNRMFVQKSAKKAGVYYVTPEHGSVGITMDLDGTLTATAERLSGFYLTFA